MRLVQLIVQESAQKMMGNVKKKKKRHKSQFEKLGTTWALQMIVTEYFGHEVKIWGHTDINKWINKEGRRKSSVLQ